MSSDAVPDASADKFASVIIKPFRLETVLRALEPFSIDEIIISEVRGYGRQKGHLELYRGAEYVISFIPKIKLEFSVPSSEADEAFEAIAQAARTGRIGDGKIFVHDTV